MTGRDCEVCRAVASELALGIAVGDERATALEHLSGCAACRRDLDGLTSTLDALMSVAPAVDPPAGFDDRVMAAFGDAVEGSHGAATPSQGQPSRPRRARVALAAAAAVILVCGLGAAVTLLRDDGPVNGSAASAAPDDLRGVLTTPDGVRVGQVTLHPGGRSGGDQGASELVITLASTSPADSYRVECDYESGRPYTAGILPAAAGGVDRWSEMVSVPTYDLRRVRLVSTTGGPNLEATMTS